MSCPERSRCSSGRSGIPTSSSPILLLPKVHHVRAGNLASFLEAVNGRRSLTPPIPTQPEESPRLNALHEYFRTSIEDKSGVCGSYLEDWLMRCCLHPLLVCGDLVMEDTSLGAKDMSRGKMHFPSKKRPRGEDGTDAAEIEVMGFEADTEAEKLRAIAFKRTTENTKRPDYTIRLRFAGEDHLLERTATTAAGATAAVAGERERVVTPLEYLQEIRCNGALPVGRFLPSNVVSVLEIKRMTENILNHVKQVAFYCESYLRVTPGRRFMVGALTNLKSLVFVAAVASEDAEGNVDYTCFYSDVIGSGNENNGAFLATQLAQLFSRSPASLGVTENHFPFHILKPKAVLGRGSTSCVFECTTVPVGGVPSDSAASTGAAGEAGATERKVAVKVSRNPHAIAMEKWVLQRLASESRLAYGLPRMVDDFAMDAVGEPYRSCMLVFDRIYKPISCKEWKEDRTLFRNVWEVLEYAHSRGIAHRDVRPANCMWDGDPDRKCVVVVDWSSASSFKEQSASSPDSAAPANRVLGCLTTASDRVIEKQISTNDNPFYDVFPVDEAQSMLYFACFALDIAFEEEVAELTKEYTVSDRWFMIQDTFPVLFDRIKRLQTFDNEDPRIHDEVLDALDALLNSFSL